MAKGKMKYVIVRAKETGCFAGYLEEDRDEIVVLQQSRRLWYWSGAASLSQLAEDGTSNPNSCKFPPTITGSHKIMGVLETIECSEKAKKSIEAVKVWSV